MMTQHDFPIAFATDTVYGLGAPVDEHQAIDRLYRLKSRPHAQPMQLLVADRAMASQWAEIDDDEPLDAQSRIYPLRALMQDRLDSRLIRQGSVAVRMPHHAALCAYIHALGKPLAASSANLRGAPSLLNANDVQAQFPDIPLVISGDCVGGTPSEIWDMRCCPPKRLR